MFKPNIIYFLDFLHSSADMNIFLVITILQNDIWLYFNINFNLPKQNWIRVAHHSASFGGSLLSETPSAPKLHDEMQLCSHGFCVPTALFAS